MIKAHVTHALENATQQALPKTDSGGLITDPKHPTAAYDNAFTLFYGKFRTNAPRIKSLIEQIEDRVDKSDEYKELLSDCHNCYFHQRDTLLSSSVTAAINDLGSSHHRDHCALVRSGCAFLIHVCEDEHQLFYQFFSHHAPQLDQFLDGLCNKLYDMLRPLFIHINHLETLAELCSILKIEMLEEHVHNSGNELNAFGIVASQMLEDVQERLVYRTHIYIRTDILQYNPSPGDLAYPEKLKLMESIAESLQQEALTRSDSKASLSSTNSSVSQDVAVLSVNSGSQTPDTPFLRKSHISPADLHGMWYPTRAIFQGLSQEVLGVCIQSLVFASQEISKRKTALDAQLFLIKHLLILREQIAPFQVDFAIKETSLDFTKIKSAAYGLFQRKNKIFLLNSNNALLEFILQGTPQVTEHFIDSKKDVDNQLKMVCEDFIAKTTKLLVGTMQSFISNSKTFIEMNKELGQNAVQLKDQPFASAEKVADVVCQGYKILKSQLATLSSSLSLYLANRETEHILFRPVRNNIHQTYEQLIQIVKNNYPEEDQTVIACPSLEQINILMNSVMTKQ
ncbi:Conserved oligomeric Golgi complex subunit 3 [Nymphon striatum]|nr:Conserved oligomeric Golgi complex subunit 3 [Nymphon striatum]